MSKRNQTRRWITGFLVIAAASPATATAMPSDPPSGVARRRRVHRAVVG